MTESGENQQAAPPHMQLINMALGYWKSRIVHAAAKLKLADHIAEGSKSAEELAETTRTDAAALYRFLRTLASLGIVSENSARNFSLTPLGQALRTGAPGSARPTILTVASELWERGWEHLPYSLETGKSGFEKMLGMPLFDWLARNPEESSLFNETMVGFHGMEPPAVAAAYDFSRFKTIVDVGGGTGNLLTTILAAHPGPRGVLFDQAHVVREAAPMIEAPGLADRVAIETGSFFEAVPAGGDAYLFSHIIHDWSEQQCLSILGHCRHGIAPDGRMLIVEMVLPPGNTPHLGKLVDMMMLVGPGGQERTEAEYRDLVAKVGFRLKRVIPTASAVSIVESEPV